MTTALTHVGNETVKPVFSVGDAIDRRNAIVELMQKEIMQEGRDYGKIPGTDKNTLLKPGAEKLASLFNLQVERPEIIERTEDWTGEKHGGEPFFYYLIAQRLARGGNTVAAQMGSCNSWEKKYRYRSSERKCPQCGVAAIKRSKYPPRDNPQAPPGWYCFAKAGGCGANFDANEDGIVSQTTGRIPNPDVADQVNSILKMAQKRALVAAVLVATNASEFFSQDAEDLEIIDAEVVPREQPKQAPPEKKPEGKKPLKDGKALLEYLRGLSKRWQDEGLCRGEDVFFRVTDWAVAQGVVVPIEKFPPKLLATVGDFLRGLQVKLREPAPQKTLDVIDEMTEELGWSADYRAEMLENTGLLSAGEVANQYTADRIIVYMREQLAQEQGADDESE